MAPSRTAPFRWRDGERTIVFGRGTLAAAAKELEPGYTLLLSPRAREAAPALVAAAGAVHEVGPGRVDELAGALLARVRGERLVALGGGRVIDVAKALAAAEPSRTVAAVPTTLSAAEMTRLHRQAAGAPGPPRLVRPQLVLCDPALAASQPEPARAASAANALGHAVEATVSTQRSPVPSAAAARAVELLAGAQPVDPAGLDPDRAADELALGALLSGYAIDAAHYGLHHVMAQTLVREMGVGHGPANAALLPHTLRALGERFPIELEALEAAPGEDLVSLAGRLARRAGAVHLRELGVAPEQLAVCAEVAGRRPELALTPPTPDRDELLALYDAAF